MKLGGASAAAVNVPDEAVPGLETTQLADPGLEAPPEDVPGLEATQLADAKGPVAVEVPPDVERTQVADPRLAVAVEATPDLERTMAEPIPGDGPTPEPVQVVCRYCRTPAGLEDRMCARCGMRLPLPSRAAPPPSAVDVATADKPIRCPSCGTKNTSGSICTGCGSLLRAPEA